jgi:hypothetical protein
MAMTRQRAEPEPLARQGAARPAALAKLAV